MRGRSTDLQILVRSQEALVGRVWVELKWGAKEGPDQLRDQHRTLAREQPPVLRSQLSVIVGYATDFKKLADEVLAPLSTAADVNLTVTIEIEATTPAGFDEAKVRTVSENASTLKFEQSGFEDS